MDKGLYGTLLRRAQAAVEDTPRPRAESAELEAFARALRSTHPAGLILCAWCGRLSAKGHWIDQERLLDAGLRARVQDVASHGICPDCFLEDSAVAESAQNKAPQD